MPGNPHWKTKIWSAGCDSLTAILTAMNVWFPMILWGNSTFHEHTSHWSVTFINCYEKVSNLEVLTIYIYIRIYKAYLRPKFQRICSKKYGFIWYSTSILGSWNFRFTLSLFSIHQSIFMAGSCRPARKLLIQRGLCKTLADATCQPSRWNTFMHLCNLFLCALAKNLGFNIEHCEILGNHRWKNQYLTISHSNHHFVFGTDQSATGFLKSGIVGDPPKAWVSIPKRVCWIWGTPMWTKHNFIFSK